MSSIPWAKSLVAVSAAVTIAATLLVPGASPTEAAPSELSPDQLVDTPGEIPCLEASPAEFRMLDCRVEVVQDFTVPPSSVTPLIVSDVQDNCSPSSTGYTAVFTGRDIALATSRVTSMSLVDGNWIRHGEGIGIRSDLGWTGLGKIGAAAQALNSTPGWGSALTQALGGSLSGTHSVRNYVPVYHWAFYTYLPETRQVDVLWSWVEPHAGSGEPRSGAVMSTRFSEPPEGQHEWEFQTRPMSPAELETCLRMQLLPPILVQQAAITPPTAEARLDLIPALYTKAPAYAPVLNNRAGTATELVEPRLVTALSSTSGITYDEPLESSLQLAAGSEVGYWNDGSCSIFSARVGYGTNLLVAKDGYARDDFEVWAASLVEGKLQFDQLLMAALVPAPPDLPEVAGKEHFQADVRVAIPDGTDIVVLKVTMRPGYRDASSSSTPGVIVAEPVLSDCDDRPLSGSFLESRFPDPIESVVVDMAGTPEEVHADPARFLQPKELRNSGGCPNAPSPVEPDAPQTTVNTACSGGPLSVGGQVHEAGIGIRSPGYVIWEIPANCSRFRFGLAYDDTQASEASPRNSVTVYRTVVDKLTISSEELLLGETSVAKGDGASPITWFSSYLSRSPGELRVVITPDAGGRTELNIIKPELTCSIQGDTIDPIEDTSDRVLWDNFPVSGMYWARSTNFWGPAEKDSSLGEDAAGDGRPLSIGGISGWASGIGVAPSAGTAESQIDVQTSARCDRLTAWVGVDDEVGNNGSVRFSVYADGKLVVRSEVKRGGDRPSFLSADVSGALVVTLGVDNAGDGNNYDHADWAEPRIRCQFGRSPIGERDTRIYEASALTRTDELNFWGPVERDMSVGEDARDDGRPMSIGSYTGWTTGFGMAPGGAYDQRAFVEFLIPGWASCRAFSSWVGVDDEVGAEGSVMFSVFVDGVLVTHSRVLRGGDPPEFLRASIHWARTIRLEVDNGGDDNRYDHANWADPVLHCE